MALYLNPDVSVSGNGLTRETALKTITEVEAAWAADIAANPTDPQHPVLYIYNTVREGFEFDLAYPAAHPLYVVGVGDAKLHGAETITASWTGTGPWVCDLGGAAETEQPVALFHDDVLLHFEPWATKTQTPGTWTIDTTAGNWTINTYLDPTGSTMSTTYKDAGTDTVGLKFKTTCTNVVVCGLPVQGFSIGCEEEGAPSFRFGRSSLFNLKANGFFTGNRDGIVLDGSNANTNVFQSVVVARNGLIGIKVSGSTNTDQFHSCIVYKNASDNVKNADTATQIGLYTKAPISFINGYVGGHAQGHKKLGIGNSTSIIRNSIFDNTADITAGYSTMTVTGSSFTSASASLLYGGAPYANKGAFDAADNKDYNADGGTPGIAGEDADGICYGQPTIGSDSFDNGAVLGTTGFDFNCVPHISHNRGSWEIVPEVTATYPTSTNLSPINDTNICSVIGEIINYLPGGFLNDGNTKININPNSLPSIAIVTKQEDTALTFAALTALVDDESIFADTSITGKISRLAIYSKKLTGKQFEIAERYVLSSKMSRSAAGSIEVNSDNVTIAGNLNVIKALEKGTGTLETFIESPLLQARVGGAIGGAAGNENLLSMGANIFEYHVIGTQTLYPVQHASGLEITCDLTNTDGLEVTEGITSTCKNAYTIGTSNAFYAKLTATLGTVAGTANFIFGFRKAAAYDATVTNYTDYAALNVNAGDIYITTNLNAAGTVNTDTTNNWADGEEHSLEVYVTDAGVVTYKIDDAPPLVIAAFTFDTTDVVIPFLYFIQNATTTTAILSEWDVNFQ